MTAPALPGWPALLPLDLALAYTQMAEDSFRFLTRKRGVLPIDADGLRLTRWRRADLDAMLDSLPLRGADKAQGEPPPANDAPAAPPAAGDLDALFAKGLAKAKQRKRG